MCLYPNKKDKSSSIDYIYIVLHDWMFVIVGMAADGLQYHTYTDTMSAEEEEALQKKANRQAKIIQEILNTEATYQNHLQLIVKVGFRF